MDSWTGRGRPEREREADATLLQVSAHLRERHAEVTRKLADASFAARPSQHARSAPDGSSAMIARLAEFRGRVASLVTAIDDHLDAADEELSSLTTQLQGLAREAEHSHEGFAQHLDATESSIDRDWSSFRADAARLTVTATEVVGLLQEHHGALTQGLTLLDGNVMTLVQEMLRDIESIGHRTENILQSAIRRLHVLREQAQTHTRRAFVDDALSTLEHGANGLLEALQALHHGASDGARSADSSSHGIMATVEHIVEIVETIRPVLDAVQALS